LVKNKAMLDKGITGHPKVGHVSPNRIFSEEEEKTDFCSAAFTAGQRREESL
jgi:hypothetical protein